MIIDSHAHVSRSDWSSPRFLEEVIEPGVRASGEPISPVVYEGTDIPAMMEAYRAAGVDKVMLGGVPAISYGPGDLRVAHADDEHCLIDELVTSCRTYALLAMDWCGVA